jgi:hypothetical protein
MNRFILLLAAALPTPALAQQPAPMTLEQTMLLRCSAAFALVAGEQGRGVARALAYPPLAERGKEFFVRAGAQVMQQRQSTYEEVEAAMWAEVERLQTDAAKAADPTRFLDDVMQPCLAALEASGL